MVRYYHSECFSPEQARYATSFYCHIMIVVRRRKSRGCNLENAPPPATCLLCGVELNSTGKPAISYLRRDNRWKDSLKSSSNTKNLMVPAAEIEVMHLAESPTLSSEFCRAVVKAPSASSYCLTGLNWVCQVDSIYDPIYMPKDVNLARIGHKGRGNPRYPHSSFTRVYPARIGRQPVDFNGKPIGYVIHAHCWALLKQVVGTTFNNTELQRFIRAARKFWHKHTFWGLLYDCFPLGPDSGADSEEDSEEPHVYQSNPHHSPFIVPEIQSAIQRAKNINSHPSSDFTSLPLELRIQIIEFVCPVKYEELHVETTRNMLSAFGWILPGSFWKLRLPSNRLLFELDSLKEISPGGWQSISLDLMPLFCNRATYVSCGLANRERVLKLIDDILAIMEKIPR